LSWHRCSPPSPARPVTRVSTKRCRLSSWP
jgi:hypothetical protein